MIEGLGRSTAQAVPSMPAGKPFRPAAAGSPLFQSLLAGSLNQVEIAQASAQAAVEKGLSGGDISQVEVMMSMKKADLALRMMVQIRNKNFEAYDEIKQLRM